MRFNNGFNSNFGSWRLLRSLRCLVDEIIRKVADPSLHAEMDIELYPASLSSMRNFWFQLLLDLSVILLVYIRSTYYYSDSGIRSIS